jgi:hypothetical protein
MNLDEQMTESFRQVTEQKIERNNEMNLDAGSYVNLFEVEFEDRETDLMRTSRRQFPDLRDFRKQLADRNLAVRVYAVDEWVYGYGVDQDQLAESGFESKTIRIREIPQLTSRMILEGYVECLKQAEYTHFWDFGRASVYQFKTPILTTPKGVKLFRGFELQSLYLLDPETENLVYGMVINAVFKYRDQNDKPLSTHEVATRFGSDTLRQLRIKQGDLAPFGGINLEVSRQRLMELTLPFVKARHDFDLPCGIPAELRQQPVRIVLSGQEQ